VELLHAAIRASVLWTKRTTANLAASAGDVALQKFGDNAILQCRRLFGVVSGGQLLGRQLLASLAGEHHRGEQTVDRANFPTDEEALDDVKAR
jgi:hypothetical protein